MSIAMATFEGDSIIDALVVNSILNCETAWIVAKALQHGGYIAGGFARVVNRHRMGLEPKPLHEVVRCYLSNGGDIDVFFRNDRDLNSVLKKVRQHSAETLASLTYVNDRQIVQLIKMAYDEPDNMIATFDIVNSMVAFDGKTLWFDERVPALEARGELDISFIDDVRTIARVVKLCSRDDIVSIAADGRALLNDYVSSIVQKTPNLTATLDGTSHTLEDFYLSISTVKEHLDKKTLMSLWLFVGNTYGQTRARRNYVSWAERELNRRAGRVNRVTHG